MRYSFVMIDRYDIALIISAKAFETRYDSTSHLLPPFSGHLPLVIDVTLVAEDHLLHIRRCMLGQEKWNFNGGIQMFEAVATWKWLFLDDTYFLYVPYPVLDIFKGLLVGDVVDEHDALRGGANQTNWRYSQFKRLFKSHGCAEKQIYVLMLKTHTIAPL